MISISIDVKKILKDYLKPGKKLGEDGKPLALYLNLTVRDNKDGRDQYGNEFFVVQDLGKEARERGERGPILGNGKRLGGQQRPHSARNSQDSGADDVSYPSAEESARIAQKQAEARKAKQPEAWLKDGEAPPF